MIYQLNSNLLNIKSYPTRKSPHENLKFKAKGQKLQTNSSSALLLGNLCSHFRVCQNHRQH